MPREAKRLDIKATFNDALSRMFTEEQIKNMDKTEKKERERMYMAGMGTTIVVFTQENPEMSDEEHGAMMMDFFGQVENYWATEAGL